MKRIQFILGSLILITIMCILGSGYILFYVESDSSTKFIILLLVLGTAAMYIANFLGKKRKKNSQHNLLR